MNGEQTIVSNKEKHESNVIHIEI